MAWDFINLGWAVKHENTKYLITPFFRLAGDDYDEIIVADVLNETEAKKILKRVLTSKGA